MFRRRMRRIRRGGREAFLAGGLVLVWALSVLNSLHMLAHSTKRECISCAYFIGGPSMKDVRADRDLMLTRREGTNILKHMVMVSSYTGLH